MKVIISKLALIIAFTSLVAPIRAVFVHKNKLAFLAVKQY